MPIRCYGTVHLAERRVQPKLAAKGIQAETLSPLVLALSDPWPCLVRTTDPYAKPTMFLLAERCDMLAERAIALAESVIKLRGRRRPRHDRVSEKTSVKFGAHLLRLRPECHAL